MLNKCLSLVFRKKGIVFVAIDQSRPLSEQGPFDIVLHKVGAFLVPSLLCFCFYPLQLYIVLFILASVCNGYLYFLLIVVPNIVIFTIFRCSYQERNGGKYLRLVLKFPLSCSLLY